MKPRGAETLIHLPIDDIGGTIPHVGGTTTQGGGEDGRNGRGGVNDNDAPERRVLISVDNGTSDFLKHQNNEPLNLLKPKQEKAVMRTIAINTMMVVACFGLVSVQSAEAGGCGGAKAELTSGAKDIVDTAVSAGAFNTLVKAVQAAGLVEALKSDGPFTVFAPTDDAFAKLPGGTLDSLLANPDQLRAILLYHVVPGKFMAVDVVKMNSVKTLLGQAAAIRTQSTARIDGANITTTDIETSNGVIHVIDSVILPENDIIEVARSAGSFKTLLAALEATGLTDALRSEGPFTVFAPTDEAFAKLPEGTLESLLNDTEQLKQILTYHVVAGKVAAEQVVNLSEATTLQGGKVRIDTSSGVKVDEARVIKTDVEATNGIIHVIDTVITPG